MRDRFKKAFRSLSFTLLGPDQDGFFRFYEREILPRFSAAPDATTALPHREAPDDWVGAGSRPPGR